MSVSEEDVDFGFRRKRMSFSEIISIFGFSFRTGNLWRFPYLCFKHGGGSFHIPYLVSFIFIAFPVYFLQSSLAQFMSFSGVQVWNLYPLAKGLGFASFIINLYLNLQLVMVITWVLYYLYRMFETDLPWTYCKESYGSNCLDRKNLDANGSLLNGSQLQLRDPAEFFWKNEVLKISNGVSSIGTIQFNLAICLLISWFVVFLFTDKVVENEHKKFARYLSKRVLKIDKCCKTTSKFVLPILNFIIPIFPIVILIIIIIKGATLNGAKDGVIFYLKPDWSKIFNSGSIWLDAASQIMYTLGLGSGEVFAVSSFNAFKNPNLMRESLNLSLNNFLISFFGGFCVFTTLGYLAHEQNVTISEVTDGGPGLMFITYPIILSFMGGAAKLMTFLFFSGCIIIGVKQQVILIDDLKYQIGKWFPRTSLTRFGSIMLSAVLCLILFLIGLFFTTNGGIYYFQIFDFYSVSGVILLFLCFCQTITIAYGYGGRRFLNDVQFITQIGFYRHILTACWYLFTPVLSLAAIVLYCLDMEPLRYGNYEFPSWTVKMGGAIALPIWLSILVVGVFQLWVFRKSKEGYKTAILRPQQVHGKSVQPYRTDEELWPMPGESEENFDDIEKEMVSKGVNVFKKDETEETENYQLH